MSDAVLEIIVAPDPAPSDGTVEIDQPGSCLACGHPEYLHEALLTSVASFLICHERTEFGECYRVRRSEGMPFGACERDPE